MSGPDRMSISLVVTVKAYPAISQKHGEAVCVAGIRTDSAPRWVRLWPVYFRDLPFSERFQKSSTRRSHGMACPSAALSSSPGAQFDNAILHELESEGF